MTLATLRPRRDTAALWTTNNPILSLGEIGWETDNLRGKVGDGTTTWNSLPYSLGDAGAVVNAKAPSGGDDLAYLQGLMNIMGAANGGTLQLRPGVYKVSNLLEVPNKVTLRGVGRSGTTVQAGTGFPTGTVLVRLGPAAALSFSSRLENLTVDANNVATSTGVYSFQGQEMCGLERVVVSGFRTNGIHFDTGASNYMISDVEVYPGTGGASNGILLKGAGSQVVNKATVGVSALLTIGINVSVGDATLIGVHAENCTDGIVIDNGRGVVIGASGPTAASNVTNLIRGTGNTRYVSIISATKNSATNTYKSDFFTYTNTDAFVQTAVIGNLQMARLQHTGDQVGFYNVTPITRQTRPGQLTVAAGTPSTTTTVDVGAAFSQTVLNNQIATLATKLNLVETALHNLGLVT